MVSIVSFGNSVLASDNVLQAIQIEGVKDSYDIILKSDDVAEVKTTVQAPDKMILNLKGIRASKTINTIYNNTSSVDSVIVEPTGDDSVKILVQAQNVSNAQVKFDSLKTPLGVLGNTAKQSQPKDELVLSEPMQNFTPVYQDEMEDEASFSLADASGPVFTIAKGILKSEKLSWIVACVLLAIIILGGLKSIKSGDNEIKVGLSQSLKDREIDLYQGLSGLNVELPEPPLGLNRTSTPSQGLAGVNYGMRAYQEGTRSPYTTSEIQRPRIQPQAQPIPQPSAKSFQAQRGVQKPNFETIQRSALKTAPVQAKAPSQQRTKTTNIDSIKFLESMTKIYEKNGRSDLAQGLKANMKKAKMNLA